MAVPAARCSANRNQRHPFLRRLPHGPKTSYVHFVLPGGVLLLERITTNGLPLLVCHKPNVINERRERKARQLDLPLKETNQQLGQGVQLFALGGLAPNDELSGPPSVAGLFYEPGGGSAEAPGSQPGSASASTQGTRVWNSNCTRGHVLNASRTNSSGGLLVMILGKPIKGPPSAAAAVRQLHRRVNAAPPTHFVHFSCGICSITQKGKSVTGCSTPNRLSLDATCPR